MRKSWLMPIGISILMATALSGQNLRMGTRYQLIDKEVDSVTTHFRDAEVTTARMVDGKLETSIRLRDGREASRTLSQPQELRLVKGHPIATAAQESVYVDLQPLDAVNADRYLAWKDGNVSARKPFAKIPSALMASAGPVEMSEAGDVLWIKSRSRGLEAFSRIGGSGYLNGRELPAFTSVLREGDAIRGIMAWYPKAEKLVFQNESHHEPVQVSAKDLPKGWSFNPNMAWANIQLLSFAKSADSHRKVTTGSGLHIIALNDPGCDGLHWLDDTIFRDCCDMHDACYYKEDPNCTVYSWWFQGSWSCVQCNINAILCFAIHVLQCENEGCVLYPDYGVWPGDGGTWCYIYWPSYCPAWCAGCGCDFWDPC